MTSLFKDIEKSLAEIADGWTSIEQACSMAASIVALRASVSVEIGVFAGKGLVSMALAHKAICHGVAIGIDPYSATASIQGQVNPEHATWWNNLDHERIYKMAQDSIETLGVSRYSELHRMTSDDFAPPECIQVLRIDGNHGKQVLRDIDRYCPNVSSGGFLFLDDKNWAGGSVPIGATKLAKSGWHELYLLDQTIVFQKE